MRHSNQLQNSESNRTAMPWMNLLPLFILLAWTTLGISKFVAGSGGDIDAEGTLVNQLVLSFSFLLAGIIVATKRGHFFESVKLNKLLFIILIYSLASCVWSPVPFVALRRWIQFFGIVLVGLAAVTRPSKPQSMLSTVLFFSATSLVISLIAINVQPFEFVMVGGAWKGLYPHKNSLGAACTLGIAVWVPALIKRNLSRKPTSLALVVIATSLILLVGSRSATAVITSFFIVCIYLMMIVRLPLAVKLLWLPVPILLMYAFLVNITTDPLLGSILERVGRDATFSGRTERWSSMLEAIEGYPIFGVGYNSFWVGEVGLSNVFISERWGLRQAHNGYIDVLNELGIIGLFLLTALLTQSLIRSYQLMKRNPYIGSAFVLIILMAILSNFMESSFCRQTSLYWTMFLIAFVAMSPLETIKSNFEKEDRLTQAPKLA